MLYKYQTHFKFVEFYFLCFLRTQFLITNLTKNENKNEQNSNLQMKILPGQNKHILCIFILTIYSLYFK